MRGVGKGLLWVGLGVGLVLLLVAGVVFYQLINFYPNQATGDRLAAEVEEAVTAHGDFTVQTSAHQQFGTVQVRLSPTSEQVTGAELVQTLAAVEEAAAGNDDPEWSVETTVRGTLDSVPVAIEGHDSAAWSLVAPALEVVVRDPGPQFYVDLTQPSVLVAVTTDAERLCGPDAAPQEFVPEVLTDAEQWLTQLGWSTSADPVLRVSVLACDDRQNVSVTLAGADRVEILHDARAVVASLPAEVSVRSLSVDAEGDLQVTTDGATSEGEADLGEELLQAWAHGKVRLNGEWLLASVPSS